MFIPDHHNTAGMMRLQTQFNITIYLNPNTIVTVKQDKKYKNLSHLKLSDNSWFHIKLPAIELLKLYYQIKKQRSKSHVQTDSRA